VSTDLRGVHTHQAEDVDPIAVDTTEFHPIAHGVIEPKEVGISSDTYPVLVGGEIVDMFGVVENGSAGS